MPNLTNKAEPEHHTEITPLYIDLPKPGKKMGSISDGSRRYWVWANEMEGLEVNVPYRIGYKDSNNDGKFFTVVGKPERLDAVSVAPANPRPANGNGNGKANGIDRELRIAALAYANHLGPILAAQSDNFTGARYEQFARHLHFKSLVAVHQGEQDYVRWLAEKNRGHSVGIEDIADTF